MTRSVGTAAVVGSAAHPAAPAVVALLDRHFTAINRRDHGSWSGTVEAQRATALAPADGQRAYRSTVDSAVEVVSIQDPTGGTLSGCISSRRTPPAPASCS